MKGLFAATLAAGLLALPGCIMVHEHHPYEEEQHDEAEHGGPPPWAPAHGYREHHEGLELVYDGHLAAYVVVGHPDVYFVHGLYFRYQGSRWESCGNWKKAKWRPAEVGVVPVTLVKYYKGKGPKHDNGNHRGWGAAKHDEDED